MPKTAQNFAKHKEWHGVAGGAGYWFTLFHVRQYLHLKSPLGEISLSVSSPAPQ